MSSVSAVSTLPKAQPMAQRRRSSLGQGSPLPFGDSRGRVSPGGRDVTPTSPSGGSSSIIGVGGALPPPSLYQPPPPLEERKSSRSSFSMPPGSPTSVAASEPPSTSRSSSGAKIKENTGRWQAEEHEIFLKGLNEHGKQWKKIAMMIKTRSVVQVRTHAQKYFQKLLKNEKKEEGGRSGKERSSSILSTSTAVSVAQTTPSGAVKRKSSTKGNKTTLASATAKKRRVSLEPKPKKQPLPHETVAAHHHNYHNYHHHQHHQAPPQLMASAPPMPVPSPAPVVDHTVIDPSFMSTLQQGDLDDSLLDLLDDSSVEAVEQVIGSDDDMDMDLEPNKVEPNPVSPSVSSMSLAETAVVHPTPVVQDVMANKRHEIVSSPNPEDYSMQTSHHTSMGSTTISMSERSPTSVACMMDMKDFEQKTSNYVDALDWLMDVGVHQLPATANESEEDWANGHPSSLAVPVVPKLSVQKLAQVNSSALSIMEGDVF